MEDTNGMPNVQQHQANTQPTEPREATHQLTINSVLHFLQSEWLKLEQQRAQWEMDRAELQAQVAFLQGERKGQENLKQDLIRRIKMLELALKSERARFHSKTGQPFTGKEANAVVQNISENDMNNVLLPAQRLRQEAEKGHEYNQRWKQSRSRLKQYLEEVGCSDTMLDIRQARMRHSFLSSFGSGANDDPRQEIFAMLSSMKLTKGGESAVDALRSLDENLASNEELRSRFTSLYEMFAAQKTGERVNTAGATELNENNASDAGEGSNEDPNKRNFPGANFLNSIELGDLLGLTIDNENVDQHGMPLNYFNNDTVQAQRLKSEQSTGSQLDQLLRHKYTCRGHFDAARAVAFHPEQAILFTASEDGSVMLFNLDKHDLNNTTGEGGVDSMEVEPSYVFRGHVKSVLCLATVPVPQNREQIHPMTPSEHEVVLFSGGLDGRICSWSLPHGNDSSADMYSAYHKSDDSGFVFNDGTKTPIWSLAISPNNCTILASASASGQVSLFELNNTTSSTSPFRSINLSEAIKTWASEREQPIEGLLAEPGRPTALAFLNEECLTALGFTEERLPPRLGALFNRLLHYPLLVAGTSTGWLCLLDMLAEDKPVLLAAIHTGAPCPELGETAAKPVSRLAGVEGWTSAGIYSITVHPTFARIWTGHEDHLVRQVNLRMDFGMFRMSLADCLQMHEDAVCSVVCEQSAGLYLYSAGCDGSIRIWDIERRKCIQEVAAHRPKGCEAMHGMALHPKQPLVATAGADGFCKVFTQPSAPPQ